jgi:cobalt-precorrin-5B (C1)-methyltransferase
MSDSAVVETIRTELSVRAAAGKKAVLFTPGNYGADFIKNSLGLEPSAAVMTSNFIGDAFALASDAGFSEALLIGHIGKLVKLAGGMFNTHSRWGDCRAEIFASHAALSGAGNETVTRIMDSAMTDDMLRLIDADGLKDDVMRSIMRKIEFQLTQRHLGTMRAGVIAFSNVYGILGMTGDAKEILRDIQGDN